MKTSCQSRPGQHLWHARILKMPCSLLSTHRRTVARLQMGHDGHDEAGRLVLEEGHLVQNAYTGMRMRAFV